MKDEIKLGDTVYVIDDNVLKSLQVVRISNELHSGMITVQPLNLDWGKCTTYGLADLNKMRQRNGIYYKEVRFCTEDLDIISIKSQFVFRTPDEAKESLTKYYK